MYQTQSAINLFRVALPLDAVSDHYRLDNLTPISARAFALRAEGHGVSGQDLRSLIRKIDKLIPPTNFGLINGEPNGNNGRPHHWYTVGKEYSRVLYLHIAKAYLGPTLLGLGNTRPFDYDKLTAKLRKLANEYGAGELDVEENTPSGYSVRIWWD